ncbi:MAG: right-handed parallel beta-helix repeat-containing protein, partial [Saprospiraceae bacterium]
YQAFEELVCYVYTNGQGNVYFDDLKIEKLGKAKNPIFEIPKLQLEIKDKGVRKLEKKREVAFQMGILESGEDDWVKAKLGTEESEESLPIKLRLKGDWLDHLKKDKWSFRVKVKDPYAWNRLKTFSLHTPAARGHLSEWVLHKFWEKEGVLTPRYDFVQLRLNNKGLGIYAYEEHFEKQLPEFKARREGIILRFAEDGFWAGIKRQISQLREGDNAIDQTVRWMQTSDIKAFKEGKVFASPTLKAQFKIAQNLMYQYKFGLKPAEDIFELDLMAKYFAICDAMGAYHGIAWHNQRFYYNPVLSKLEPIGFDGFPSYYSLGKTFLGQGAFNKKSFDGGVIFTKLFHNEKFTEKYIRYLYEYTSRPYLQNFLGELTEGIANREELLQAEFKDYTFDRTQLMENAQRINIMILPHHDLSLKVHLQANVGGRLQLKLGNAHGLPLRVVGYGKKATEMTNTLDSTMLLPAYQTRDQFKYQDLSVKGNPKYVFFKLLGMDSLFHSKILNYSLPEDQAPAQELFANGLQLDHPAYTVNNQVVFFPKGKTVVKQDIIIPEGYQVSFEAGAQLDLVQKAKFISRSPVKMFGTSEEPIKVFSSDQTGNGFTVLQASEESKLRHVIFENLNTLSYKSWNLTGAVNFYESVVDARNCAFRKNHCEDALNIIRSSFYLEKVFVSDTKADGFDADFCQGSVVDSRFYNTGNDGVDVSGSKVTIRNCTFDGCEDKGISVGEESQVEVYQTTISNTALGLAAKDLSKLTVHDISLNNCKQGFAAYQKKPEFGPSKIIVKNYTTAGVKHLYQLARGCVLILKDQRIEGE